MQSAAETAIVQAKAETAEVDLVYICRGRCLKGQAVGSKANALSRQSGSIQCLVYRGRLSGPVLGMLSVLCSYRPQRKVFSPATTQHSTAPMPHCGGRCHTAQHCTHALHQLSEFDYVSVSVGRSATHGPQHALFTGAIAGTPSGRAGATVCHRDRDEACNTRDECRPPCL